MAEVRLDEGVHILSNLVNFEKSDLVIGKRVKPFWHSVPDGTNFLMFPPE